MTSVQTIDIDGRSIGPTHPVYLVAEIGLNHNGDMDLAHAMIDAGARAGADAVKFQSFSADEFVGDLDATYTYTQSDGKAVTENLLEMFRRCELSRDELGALARYCKQKGISWHSTPMDTQHLADLVELDVPVIKNGSDCLGYLPLIRAMGETGRPVVLATGMSTLADVEEAVQTLLDTGNEQIIVLHCTSQYPTPAEEANLRRVSTLLRTFGVLAGFSDHTEGPYAAVASVALGACWIEKHFTIDKNLPGPDHRFSADPAEFAELVRSVRYVESALGKETWRISEKEADARNQHRLSCVAIRDIETGTKIALDDITFMRPGTGLKPALADLLIGRKLACPLKRGELYTPDKLV